MDCWRVCFDAADAKKAEGGIIIIIIIIIIIFILLFIIRPIIVNRCLVRLHSAYKSC